MEENIYKLEFAQFPPLLKEINDPPKTLYLRGEYPDVVQNKFLCVVGSRKYSNYGKEATKTIISGLRGYPIVIVSGLAMGIDTIAHESAIENGLKTIAIPGSGLSQKVIYPRVNFNLAERIIKNGGVLMSEFEPGFKATPWSFPQRNRIMAGISHAVLVIEANEKSGTLITARLACEYNRDVYVVPGSIFQESSKGPHMFLKIGATPITSSADILNEFGFGDGDKETNKLFDDVELTDDERKILNILDEPTDKETIIEKAGLPVHRVSIALSTLEMKGFIKENMGQIFRL
ncbi:DNA-protecting protein DprA [Candidatus Campbellbacteria bacterium CG22_combo_CG10-13_8_21_14_all_36_13]|uniref:DNA-protecting protein DprA n=1 Tax=Candidatus Campbellbacteria bacterium CG22_combo_CG10-13_8_21_14_all_36_13 TaxID=1974529 RepID=A0A2H0DXX6_9BACT|nr:MAG: DNA-protecting protein DprA [Candidatus Campbellbacteria bacterium CG22_combo_CG10-13_8_21_14_all_36_13]